MIHLFNNVYLDLDLVFSRDDNYFIASPKVKARQYISAVDRMDLGNVLSTGESLYDMAQPYGGEDGLFSWLLKKTDDQRYVLACDPVAFERMFIRAIKTILWNSDFDTHYLVYTLMKKRYFYCWSYPYLPWVKLTEEQAAGYKAFGAQITDKAIAQEQWKSIPSFTLDAAQRLILQQGASTEYQVASYYVDPNWAGATPWLDRVDNMLIKFLGQEFLELKRTMRRFLPAVPEMLVFSMTVEQLANKYPQYVAISDIDRTDEATSPQDMLTKANLSLLNAVVGFSYDYMNQDVMAHLDPRQDMREFMLHLGEVGASQSDGPTGTTFIGEWKYRRSFNTYLMNEIFRRKLSGNIDQLRLLSVL